MKNIISAPMRQHLLAGLWVLKSACKLSALLATEALRWERGPRVTQQAILMRGTLHFHLKFS